MSGNTTEPGLRRRERCTALSDRELIDAAREGSCAAYEELWRRHAAPALAFARGFAYAAEPDELVDEAFTRILATLRRGTGGPAEAFRPYLLTTIRNVAATWARRTLTRKEQSVDDFELFEGDVSAEDTAVSVMERSTVIRALRTLPSNWQAVLWYTEVERMPREDVARLLGLKPNAVSQLSFRARDALRTAWVQAHVDDDRVPEECREASARLGAYARGRLSARDRRKVDVHLEECATCSFLAGDLNEVSSRFARIALVALLGVSGAAAYQTWQAASGAGVTAATAATANVAVLTAGRGRFPAKQASMWTLAAASVLVATLALASVLTVTPDGGVAAQATPEGSSADATSAVPVADALIETLPPLMTPGVPPSVDGTPSPAEPPPTVNVPVTAVANDEQPAGTEPETASLPAADPDPASADEPISEPPADPGPAVYHSDVVSAVSSQCLTAAALQPAAVLQLGPCARADTQVAEYIDGAQTLSLGGWCFDDSDGGLVLAACDGGARQRWAITDSGLVVNAGTGRCLDVQGNATAPGTRIIAWPCHGRSNQQWTTGFPMSAASDARVTSDPVPAGDAAVTDDLSTGAHPAEAP